MTGRARDPALPILPRRTDLAEQGGDRSGGRRQRLMAGLLLACAVSPAAAEPTATAATRDPRAVAIAAGTAVTAAAIQSMSTPQQGRAAACTMSTAVIDGLTYYHCAPNWFQKAYVNGEMTYVSVAPPPGY